MANLKERLSTVGRENGGRVATIYNHDTVATLLYHQTDHLYRRYPEVFGIEGYEVRPERIADMPKMVGRTYLIPDEFCSVEINRISSMGYNIYGLALREIGQAGPFFNQLLDINSLERTALQIPVEQLREVSEALRNNIAPISKETYYRYHLLS